MSRNHHRRQRHQQAARLYRHTEHQHGRVVTAIESCKPWLAGAVVLAGIVLFFALIITAPTPVPR